MTPSRLAEIERSLRTGFVEWTPWPAVAQELLTALREVERERDEALQEVERLKSKYESEPRA